MNTAWFKRGGCLNIPESWRRRENTNDDREEGKEQGRNQNGDAEEGTSIASTAQNWNKMKAFSPKAALLPSTNSSPPSARCLPEAGAGPQSVGVTSSEGNGISVMN